MVYHCDTGRCTGSCGITVGDGRKGGAGGVGESIGGGVCDGNLVGLAIVLVERTRVEVRVAVAGVSCGFLVIGVVVRVGSADGLLQFEVQRMTKSATSTIAGIPEIGM